MRYHLNCLDEPISIAVTKPLLTEFGVHLRLESCGLVFCISGLSVYASLVLEVFWVFSSLFPYCDGGNSLNILLSTVLFSEKYHHLEMLSFVSTYSWSYMLQCKKNYCVICHQRQFQAEKDYNLDFFVSRFAAVCRNLKFWPNYCIRDIFIGRPKKTP